MSATTRQQVRPDRPPTREQLFVLADRAERGRLTAAEADRLRIGIAELARERRETGGFAGARAARSTRSLRLVASLAAAARRRGETTLPVALVETALQRSGVAR